MSLPRLNLGACSTVATGRQVRQSRKVDPVQLVADHLLKPYSVCQQVLKPSDPRCPFPLAGEISAALYAGGRGDVAERLRLPIDLARFGGHVVNLDDALILETEMEGLANNAQQAFSLDHSAGALDTMVRRWQKQVEVLQLAILAAKAQQR